MATVKKANVPPTHPTVWVGLGLSVLGLLVAIYAYTGARVYDIIFAFVALAGGLLALAGIMTAAWGRSIMAARATRARRTTISKDALAIAKPEEEPRGSEEVPTVAAPSSKKGFSFPLPGRIKREEKPKEKVDVNAIFAFKRRPVVLAPPEPAKPVRATLKCPQCASQFTAEGVRPFDATCPSCGFASTI